MDSKLLFDDIIYLSNQTFSHYFLNMCEMSKNYHAISSYYVTVHCFTGSFTDKSQSSLRKIAISIFQNHAALAATMLNCVGKTL